MPAEAPGPQKQPARFALDFMLLPADLNISLVRLCERCRSAPEVRGRRVSSSAGGGFKWSIATACGAELARADLSASMLRCDWKSALPLVVGIDMACNAHM